MKRLLPAILFLVLPTFIFAQEQQAMELSENGIYLDENQDTLTMAAFLERMQTGKWIPFPKLGEDGNIAHIQLRATGSHETMRLTAASLTPEPIDSLDTQQTFHIDPLNSKFGDENGEAITFEQFMSKSQTGEYEVLEEQLENGTSMLTLKPVKKF